MARIAGVNIPTNKRVEIALTYIHGIGRSKAKQITDKLGIGAEKRVQDLTDQEVLHIRESIDADHQVEGDLRRETSMNIKRLMDLGCYRGVRHKKGLPVRGQRTRTNARTRKGKAKPIAGKRISFPRRNILGFDYAGPNGFRKRTCQAPRHRRGNAEHHAASRI